MPQMMPMNWMMLYSISISMILMFIIINYYQHINFKQLKKMNEIHNYWNWKW